MKLLNFSSMIMFILIQIHALVPQFHLKQPFRVVINFICRRINRVFISISCREGAIDRLIRIYKDVVVRAGVRLQFYFL